MSFRRALLILGVMFVAGGVLAYFLPSYIELPNNVLELAFIGGLLSFIGGLLSFAGKMIELLPSLKDSAEFIQSLFTREEPTLDPREYDLNSPQALRHRENLLNHVRHVWIEGQNAFLEHAIHHQVMIELGLHYDQQAVDDNMPLNRVLLHAQRAPTPIPANQTIADVYRTHGRSILILGAPGSGKTIMLVRLAKMLLAEAVADQNAPAPVVMPLASWANQRQPLIDWLVEQIFLQYQIGRKLSRQWLQDGRLVLLLDGLDEVAEAHREACVSAINTFREEHACEMVVTSRSEDYAQLAEKLRLNTAVELQPLTLPDMHGYLNRFGYEMEVEPIHDMLDNDDEFRKLAQTPLMLTLFPLAYNRNTINIPTTGTQTTRRQHLFHTYLQSALKRRPLPAAYTLKNALHWLRNLAYLMTTHDQTPFYIENMQPMWLSNQRPYRWGLRFAVFFISAIVSGLVFELSAGLIFGLIFRLNDGRSLGLSEQAIYELSIGLGQGLIYWLSIGLSIGLSVGLIGGLSVGIGFVGKMIWTPLRLSSRFNFLKPLRGGLIFLLSVGLISGLTLGLILLLVDNRIVGLTGQRIGSLIGGLISQLTMGLIGQVGLILWVIGGLNGLLDASKIMLTESLTQQYSYRYIWRVFKTKMQQGLTVGLIFGLMVGLLVGLAFGLNDAVSNGLIAGLIFGLIIGLVLGLILGLIVGLLGLLSEGIMGEAQSNNLPEKAIPNQGIWLSGRNGLRMGLIGMIRDAIVFAGILSLLSGFSDGDFVSAALFGGIFGAGIGFLGGFWDYGLAVVQHYIVRWLLRDRLPHPLSDKKLVAYFDSMVERLVLQRVGGGWRFIHRELQEYVAGLSDAQLDELAALVEGGETG